jgi:hypothetical protein
VTDKLEVVDVAPMSPHNTGLYEAGKTLLVESVAVGRDFCKAMITIATGGIPTYVVLVGLAVGKSFRPTFVQGAVLSMAPASFLLAAAAFAMGYFPKRSTFSLDVPSEIDAARKDTLTKRMRWSGIGFGLLMLAIALSLFGMFYALSLHSSPRR